MSGGDTTQFLFAPNLTPGNRKVVLALAGLFCASCLLCTVLLIVLDIYQSSMKSLLALFGSPVVIAAALLPNILLAFLIPLLQRHQRTHRYVLIGAFLAGAVIAIPPAGTINTILFLPFTALHLRLIGYGTVPGIVEEGIKGLLLLFIYFLYRDEFHDAVDGVVLGALVGLGFAMTEDIEYFLSGLTRGGLVGLAVTFFLRVFLGWMNHSVFTATFGAALGMARLGPPGLRRWAWGVGGYVVAAGLHNSFDFLATLLGRVAPLLVFLLYGGIWLAMLLLAFVVLLGWRREAEIIRDELHPEVATGVVGAEEYAALPHPGRRRALLRAAAAQGGAARSALGKIFQLEINLALQRRHTAYGDRPRVPRLHSEESLRARIANLRAALQAAGAPPALAAAGPGQFPLPPSFAPPPPPPPGGPPPLPPRYVAAPPGYDQGSRPFEQDRRGPPAPWAAPPPLPAASGVAPTAAGQFRLVVTTGDQAGAAVMLEHDLTIGRDARRAAFVLADPAVSGLHARIERNGGLPVLVDAGSTNGTYVNDERVTRRALRPGDRVTLGDSQLVVTGDG